MTAREKKLQPMATTLSLNVYAVIESAVGAGVARGWTRAHKHTDAPGEDLLRTTIEESVMEALTEVINWP